MALFIRVLRSEKSDRRLTSSTETLYNISVVLLATEIGTMKVVIDVASGRLAIEGDGPELLQVLEAARSLAPNVKQIQIVTSTESPNNGEPADEKPDSTPHFNASPQSQSPKTLRQFARSLALNNAPERIAAIAYYVNRIEGRHSFSPKEMDGWFTMSGFQKPSQMAVALFDTKRKYGY